MFLILAALAIGGYFVLRGKGKAAPPSTPQHHYKGTESSWVGEMNYLKARWGEREAAKQRGEPCDPRWWWDAPTEAQKHRASSEAIARGIRLSFEPDTKGTYSDVIGVFEEPSDDELEVLRFFKIALKGMNQTRARYEVRALMADPEKRAKFEAKPATALQKDFFEFFGLEFPKGLNETDAARIITEQEETLRETPRWAEWESYQMIWDDLDDPDTRETYEIKKPSRAQVKKALAELVAAGYTYDAISMDIELLAAKLPQAKDFVRVLLGEVDEKGRPTSDA